MYVTAATIANIRAVRDLSWEPGDDVPLAGWHVLLGANGAGKSSALRAIALALVGPTEAVALRQRWDDWLRRGESVGYVSVHLEPDPRLDVISGTGRPLANWRIPAGVTLKRSEHEVHLDAREYLVPGRKKPIDMNRYVWGGGSGWFSASYGPLRRFTGSDQDTEKLYYSNPLLARHLTLFGESVALSECLSWLQHLRFESLEAEKRKEAGGGSSGRLLAQMKEFVNQAGFLPHEAKLVDITSRGVLFVDGNGFEVSVEELSDGYQSILSLTFELIRQLVTCYGVDPVFGAEPATKINVPGVVLIDEVDAHLHPSWQRRIGFFLTEHFPRMQFIVATHSPLVCQAAVKGSVFRLSRPGSDEKSAMVTGPELDRLLYGNVLDAYATKSFGIDVGGRSALGKQKLARLASLNQKEIEEGLSVPERAEQATLRSALPTAAAVLRENGRAAS